MALPTLFAGLSTATGAQLDADLAALGAISVIGCAASGTNTIALAVNANTPTVAAYANYMLFSAVAAGTNTSATTAAVGGLAALSVFKDGPTGPIALTGGEIVAGNFFMLAYDSALPGFHLINQAQPAYTFSARPTVNSATGTTLTAANITGSGAGSCIILRTGAASGGISDTTDTATAILAALPGATIGSTFRLRISNTTTQTLTLLGGSGVTIVGTATTANATTHEWEGIVTATGTPAISMYG